MTGEIKIASGTQLSFSNHSEKYFEMTKKIEKNLPVIIEACSNFGKTQSQFMDNFLTVSHPTPLRNARQILAEVIHSVDALKEAQYKTKVSELLVRRHKRDLARETDELKKEELALEIEHESSKFASSLIYIEGAIRSITNYMEQYDKILKSAGYSEMNEEAFENEEEAYHIMKAFEQGICAARSRGGFIDEGNQIYLSQIGVNGQMAQNFVNKFFAQEKSVLESGATLSSDFQRDFLKNMADYFKGCSKSVAKSKGMSVMTESALIKKDSNLYQIRGTT